MILIPKIYIKDGKTLLREDTKSTLFSEDPFSTARAMMNSGSDALYVMDLNIAPVGQNPNLKIIKKIRSELKMKILLGGAFRAPQSLGVYNDVDIELIVLDANAYQQPQIVDAACKAYPKKIAVNIDVRDERVVIPGWTVAANKTAYDYAERFLEQGVDTFFYSNTASDGRVSESNLDELRTFCKRMQKNIYCTNELDSIDDIVSLVTLGAPRLEGIVLDRALYRQRIDLKGANAYIADLVQDSNNEPTLHDM